MRHAQEYRQIAAGEPILTGCGEYLEGKVTCVVVNASGFLAYLTGARDELVQVGVAGVEPVVDPAGSEGVYLRPNFLRRL